MIKYVNECRECATDSYPCLGSLCENRHVKHLICDKCRKDVDVLYVPYDEELCLDCLEEAVDKITLDDD